MIFNIKDTDTAERVTYRDTTVAQALNTVENELTANNTRIYLDYQDNKYGYNTSPLRGADTFHPFSRPNPYTQLRTIDGVGGDELPELTGSGYITLTRAWGTGADDINVYIDENGTPFSIDGLSSQTFMYNSKIRFTGGVADRGYYLQILSSETPVNEYNVLQSIAIGSYVLTANGKGKALFNALYSDVTLYFSIDNSFMSTLPLTMYKPVWISFNEKITFSCSNDDEWAQYIIYTKK